MNRPCCLTSSRIQAVNRLSVHAAFLLFMLVSALPSGAQDLKLLVSVQQQSIISPGPIRATLHFHNSGKQTVWLYQPIRNGTAGELRGPFSLGAGAQSARQAYGGSALEVHLEPTGAQEANAGGALGNGSVILPDGLPFPRLVRLAPDQDYEQKVSIHVDPAQTKSDGGTQPVWGSYNFSVIYSADYSNADALARDINAYLWHGRVISNTVTLNLQPPAAQGAIEGSVVDAGGRPFSDLLVTLSDENEDALNQTYTDDNGRFSFTHVASGRFWLTVRQPGSGYDTSVFRQVDVGGNGQPTKVQIMMLPVEPDKPDRVLHKPVLFNIVDEQGRPLPNARLAILHCSGNVLENRKARTGNDGFAAVSLIPGSNILTIRMEGCKDVERPIDVARGPGVDGFKFDFECVKK
jgi:hypothetical protein